ncbi:MAG: prephenate dehydrogenase [Lachnospiraceae bacterium]|nr:prephenate dehydrogenase [Lachnospiraceae bacterium]
MNAVGIIGLGLIGGSMAKAAEAAGYKVYGSDASADVVESALKDGVLSGRLEDHYGDIGMLMVALYPLDVVDIILETAPKLPAGCIVVDCTGVKKMICSALSERLSVMGLRFIGGHPMAGKEVSGYENACADLFVGASMILCTDEFTDSAAVDEACGIFPKLGFSQVKITTADEHDRVIAFTSQLAHVVSSAYIKSPTLDVRYGFSAGSFKDMTRVALLNENMWADLFLANRDDILREIRQISEHLKEFDDAIEERNRDALVKLLADGRVRKERDNAAEGI